MRVCGMRVRRNNFLSHAEDWGLFRLARISRIPGSPIAGAAQGFGGRAAAVGDRAKNVLFKHIMLFKSPPNLVNVA